MFATCSFCVCYIVTNQKYGFCRVKVWFLACKKWVFALQKYGFCFSNVMLLQIGRNAFRGWMWISHRIFATLFQLASSVVGRPLAAVGADSSCPHIRKHPQNDERICVYNEMNIQIRWNDTPKGDKKEQSKCYFGTALFVNKKILFYSAGTSNLSPVCSIIAFLAASLIPGRAGRAPQPVAVRSNLPSFSGFTAISLNFTIR